MEVRSGGVCAGVCEVAPPMTARAAECHHHTRDASAATHLGDDGADRLRVAKRLFELLELGRVACDAGGGEGRRRILAFLAERDGLDVAAVGGDLDHAWGGCSRDTVAAHAELAGTEGEATIGHGSACASVLAREQSLRWVPAAGGGTGRTLSSSSRTRHDWQPASERMKRSLKRGCTSWWASVRKRACASIDIV